MKCDSRGQSAPGNVGGVKFSRDVPALVARDAEFAGNEAAFCEAYARGAYAPDLK